MSSALTPVTALTTWQSAPLASAPLAVGAADGLAEYNAYLASLESGSSRTSSPP
jgi:hypothetical protein